MLWTRSRTSSAPPKIVSYPLYWGFIIHLIYKVKHIEDNMWYTYIGW